MDCIGRHQVVDVEWKFGGNIFCLVFVLMLYISSPSIKGFGMFPAAYVVLAYIFLILSVFLFSYCTCISFRVKILQVTIVCM